MPQASDELRDLMLKRFGSRVDDAGPTKYLEKAGYKLTSDFEWIPKEGVKELKDMTREEFDCLLFLVHEWDYGILTTASKTTA